MPDPEDFDLPDVLIRNYYAVLSQIQLPYMADLLALDMRQILDRITCPVMALNGTKDTQVHSESNLSAIRAGGRRESSVPALWHRNSYGI